MNAKSDQTMTEAGSQRTSPSVSGATRMERDTMGELAVPAAAYYGVQTARAVENFPIS